MMTNKRALLPMLACLLLAALPAAAADLPPVAQAATAAETPSSVLTAFYAQLISVMKDGQKLGFKGRYDKLKPVIEGAYDLPLMTRLAVGADWAKASAAEQSQVIEDFSGFSVATYANRFGSYNGETFQVIDEKPAPAPTGAILVETRLTPTDGDPVMLTYLVHKNVAGQWKIMDVFVNGTISELATRRAEFSTVVRSNGIQALMALLTQKAADLGSS